MNPKAEIRMTLQGMQGISSSNQELGRSREQLPWTRRSSEETFPHLGHWLLPAGRIDSQFLLWQTRDWQIQGGVDSALEVPLRPLDLCWVLGDSPLLCPDHWRHMPESGGETGKNPGLPRGKKNVSRKEARVNTERCL